MKRYRKTIPIRYPDCRWLAYDRNSTVCYGCQSEARTLGRERNYVLDNHFIERLGRVKSNPCRLEPSNNEDIFTCVNGLADIWSK